MSRIRFLILEADIPAPPLRPPSGRHAGGGIAVDEPQLTAVRQNCRRLRGRENGDGLGRERIRAQKEPHLHDGRARNYVEAIMWHGGEGEASKNLFKKMSKEDRNALVAFLKSL